MTRTRNFLSGALEGTRLAMLVFWLLPVAAPIWLFYILPVWALGGLKYRSCNGLNCVFEINGWFNGLWRGRWLGHAMPFAVVVRSKDWLCRIDYTRNIYGDCYDPVTAYQDSVIAHELRHCEQWQAFGVLFPVVYLLLLLRFGYWDNPLEVDARGAG